MPIDSNPEDKGRFLKDILQGVPSGYGLTRGEQTVRELSRISQTLNSVRSRLPASTSSSKTEFITVPSPQTQDLSRVESVMGDVSVSQSRTADNTDRLTEQGAESLQLQNTLVSLGIGHARQNRTAIEQRDQLIGQGEIGIQDLHLLVSNSQTANALLQTLGEQGFISLLVQAGILKQGAEIAAQGDELVNHAVRAAQSREVAQRQRATLVDNSRLAVTVLESLDAHGRDAYIQRLKIVSEVAQTRGAIEMVGQDLVRSGQQTHRDLSAIHSQGGQILAESQQHTRLLDGQLTEARGQSQTLNRIHQTGESHLRESRLQTQALGVISEIGLVQLSALRDLGGMMGTAVSVLKDIDYGITEVNRGLDRLNFSAAQAVEHLSDISMAMNMFVITSHQIREQLVAINRTLRNPVTVRAENLWSIGERCRQAGDITTATEKFLESQREDPSSYKNYYSLALASLELGIVDAAEDFLMQSLAYAQQSGAKAEQEVLHLLGKVELMTHRPQQALQHLYKAYEKDPNAFAVWYDIALAEMILGDKNAALGFLNALVRVAKAKSPGYLSKIKAEPIFSPIINQLPI